MDPRPYLREFDVFVLAARQEPLALRVLDAMALDLPVIAPDEGAPGEVLEPVHGITGASLYPPGDAAALAALVRRVRDEPGLHERMRVAQRTRIEDFRVERMAESVLALYREVSGAT
jgi:phosphatidylinositol alpha 1,6-mannosyltransferase